MDNRKKALTWLAYVPVGLALIYLSLIEDSLFTGFQLDYLLFLLLGIGVAIFPIRTDDSVFTMISGVSVAAFVVFGLLPELILTSIAILYVLFRADIRWDQNYRYALNLLMVAVLSIISAFAYYWIEDILLTLGFNNYQIIPLATYLIVQIITNNFFQFLVNKYYYQRKNANFFNHFLVFSLRISLIILPLSLTLIYLYLIKGTLGIFFGGLPFMVITIGLKHYYKSKNNNILLKDLNKYSQRLASKTNMNDVINSFSKYLLKLFPSQQILYFDVIDSKHVILKRVYHLNRPVTYLAKKIILEDDSVSSQFLETQKIITYSRAEKWYTFFASEIDFDAESVIVLPVNILNQHKGVIVMTHNQQFVYDDFFNLIS